MPTKERSPSRFVPRSRKVRILATLGPASDSPAMIRRLVEAGADAFRINMSHGDHKDHARRIAAIRALEADLDRPTTILADLQGPKLRVGRFKGDKAELKAGQSRCRTARFSSRSRPGRACWSTTASWSSESARSRRTGSRPRSRSAARSPTIRASTCPTWCFRWRR